jgi:hypothetical protein
LHPALPGGWPAVPPGKTEFQLADLTLFDLILATHKYLSFRYARHFTRAGWTKAVQVKKYFSFSAFANSESSRTSLGNRMEMVQMRAK